MVSDLKKKLCTLSVICALTLSTAVAAEEQASCDALQGLIKEYKKADLNDEYINSVRDSLSNEIDNRNFSSAKALADYYVDISKKYYGRHNYNTASAYLTKARLYKEFMIPDLAKKEIQKANSTIKWHLINKDFKNTVNLDYDNYYGIFEQPYDAIKYINKTDETKFRNPSFKDARLADMYVMAGETKNAVEYYKKAVSKLDPQNPEDKELYINYYNNIISNSQQRSEIEDNLKKLVQVTDTLPKSDVQARIGTNYTRLDFYSRFEELSSHKKLLDETNALILKHPTDEDRLAIARFYLSYYSYQNRPDMVKKYEKIIAKLEKNEETPFVWDSENPNSLASAKDCEMRVMQKLGEYYGEGKNDSLTEAQNMVDTALSKIEPVKKYSPNIYAKFIGFDAQIKMAKGDYAQAKALTDKYVSEVKKQKFVPDIMMLDAYNMYIDIYMEENNDEKALEYLKKSLEITKKLRGENSEDVIGVNSRLIEMYSKLKQYDKVAACAEQIIEISKNINGENHVRTYGSMFDAYWTYNEFDTNKADEILNTLVNNISSGNVHGNSPYLFFGIYMEKASKEQEKANYKSAAAYGEKALKYAWEKEQKAECYNLLINSYSHISGKKALVSKYKKLKSALK